MDTIKKFADKVEVYSIDECFVDLTDVPDDQLKERLIHIKEEVKRQTGIPVSIGVGPNKILAKLTSKIAKKQLQYNGVCSFWDVKNFDSICYDISVDEVWGIGRKWAKKLKKMEVYSVGQFKMMDDRIVRKLMNVNGLRTKMELLGYYSHPITEKPRLKKNIASTRSFGEDIDSFEQLSEAMYSYIESGVKKLIDNEVEPNRATIFVCGNKHKGENHYKSIQITLQRQTRDVNEIWSQIYPHLQSIYDSNKKYKKCGVVFNYLIPEQYEQMTLFVEDIEPVTPPSNEIKRWEMKQDFISQRYTTSWEELPLIFV